MQQLDTRKVEIYPLVTIPLQCIHVVLRSIWREVYLNSKNRWFKELMDQHRLIYASKQVLKYLMYMVSTLTESGPPYSYRTRGYLSSFPGT